MHSAKTPAKSAKTLLTPKDVADAIGVSESSLRRWVDAGQIQMSRTSGGHRRIPLQEAVRFIRESGTSVIRPEALGFNPAVFANLRAPTPAAGSDADRLFEALQAGDRKMVTGLMLSWYVNGKVLAALLDGPIRNAVTRLGELWSHDARGILVEHRATELLIHALLDVRAIQPIAARNAPVAVGGAPEGDPYVATSIMAAMTLSEVGYRDVNYGANTPLHLLADAAHEHAATLVWVSMMAPLDVRAVRNQVVNLATKLARRKTMLVLGGRHAAEAYPKGEANVHLAGSMGELSALARGMMGRIPRR